MITIRVTLVYHVNIVNQKFTLETEKIIHQNIRFKIILDSTGLNNTEFAREVGISKGQVSHLLSGEREVSETLAKLLYYKFGILENWTLKGEGDMRNTTPSNVTEAEKKLIEKGIILSRKIIKNSTLCEIAEMLVKIQPDDLKKIKTIVETFVK
ncbi:helix-turn-helix transcriptional regulator [Leptospira noguchii]|uniref:helix-turn-helix domain-containing protein n=1 Tax=Leptospira noguchii TaxID=28182 RepID=UPI000AA342DF